MAFYTLALQSVTVEEIPGTFANKKILILHVAEPLSSYALNDTFSTSDRIYDPFEFTILVGGGLSPLYSQEATDLIATSTQNKPVELGSNGSRNIHILMNNEVLYNLSMANNLTSACLILMHFSDNNYLPTVTYFTSSTITSHGGTVTPPSTTTYGYAATPARTDGYGLISLNFSYTADTLEAGNTIAGAISPPPTPDPDPYAPGGYSGTGGGGGTFDLDSDIIGLPPLPTLSFAATGFTRIYNPTLSQLNALANYLWTDQTFLDTVINHLKQLLENPMDAVISLSLLPCSIPNGTPEAVKVMYINTGVSMAPATTQFVDVDCGTYTIEEFYGSALDYNPYTKVHCYLPYIGQVTLDTDEVMGRTLNVVYRIDIVTGMCAAMILVDQNVLYQFSGHCAINMPINSADFSGYIGAAMTAGKMVAGVVAGAAGASALAAELIGAPAPHSSTSETTEKTTERNPKTGRQITAGTSTRTTTRNTPGASFGELSRKAAANTVGAVMGSKLTVEHAGGFTGNSGYLAVRRPYLIIERPRMCNPEEYGKYNGRPSMIYMNLGECEGYTEVQSIQFENIPATNPELAELSELLKSGVLF